MALIISTMPARYGAGQEEALTAGALAGIRLVSAPASRPGSAGLTHAGRCNR
jgi:hypothetical protein